MNSLLNLLLAALAPALQQPVGVQGTLDRFPQEQARPDYWVTNGGCSTAVLERSSLYIGGKFTHVGPFSGPFAVVGSDSGALAPAPAKFDGTIEVIVGDNAGGWYLGGDFTRNAGHNLDLVHLLPGGALDTNFAPQPDGHVDALRLAQNWLYVGGSFSSIGGQPIPALARIDALTGVCDPNWHPLQAVPGYPSRFHGLVLHGNTLYAFGSFNSPPVLPRNYIAAFDTSTAALLPWNPNPNGWVLDVIVSGSTVYVGGEFTSIAGAQRNRLAALDSASGAALPFNPDANGGVQCLGLSGSTLYAGGSFTSLGGQPRGRGGAVDSSSGALLAWDPALTGYSNHQLHDLVIRNGSVFVCGQFETAGGESRWNLAQLDGISGAATAWRVDVAGPDSPSVDCLANQGPLLALGGSFRTVGGEPRESVAALDRRTGRLQPWHPSVWSYFGVPEPGQVFAIVPSDNGIYLGGVFASINTTAVRDLALVDASTGVADPAFHTSFLDSDNFVRRLVLDGERLYCGGSFVPAPGVPRSLAALDPHTGRPVGPWLGVGGSVYDMALARDRSQLFVCGSFNWAGLHQTARSSVASMNPDSGDVLPWDAHLGAGLATSLCLTGESLYVTGGFTSVAGQSRLGLARFELSKGLLSPWYAVPQPNPPSCVLELGSTVLLGGGFYTINQVWQAGAAALSESSPATLLDWTPESSGCLRFVSDDRELVALGGFRSPDGAMRPNFTVFGLR